MSLFEAALSGFQAARTIAKQERGYQAAREQYGEGPASDPGLFSALQNMEMQRQARDRGIIESDRQYDLARRADARQGAAARREQRQFDQSSQIVDTGQREKGVLSVVNGLIQARDSGQDIGAAFDGIAGILPNLGVDPADVPAMREELLRNPAMLDAYRASLTGGGGATATRVSGPAGATGTSSATDGGAPSPEAAQAAQDVSHTVKSMIDLYDQLNEGGGIVNTELDTGRPLSDTVSNVSRYVQGLPAAREIGRITGSSNESARRQIEGLRVSLINAMKSAEGMGARMFDSNKDMELWLQTVSSPDQDYATATRLLREFDRKYGAAMAGEQVAPINVEQTLNDPNYQNPEIPDAIWPGFQDPLTGQVFQGIDEQGNQIWVESAPEEQGQMTRRGTR